MQTWSTDVGSRLRASHSSASASSHTCHTDERRTRRARTANFTGSLSSSIPRFHSQWPIGRCPLALLTRRSSLQCMAARSIHCLSNVGDCNILLIRCGLMSSGWEGYSYIFKQSVSLRGSVQRRHSHHYLRASHAKLQWSFAQHCGTLDSLGVGNLRSRSRSLYQNLLAITAGFRSDQIAHPTWALCGCALQSTYCSGLVNRE